MIYAEAREAVYHLAAKHFPLHIAFDRLFVSQEAAVVLAVDSQSAMFELGDVVEIDNNLTGLEMRLQRRYQTPHKESHGGQLLRSDTTRPGTRPTP